MARRRSLMAEINVVPYIDVMLVLLIIFMITAPLLTQGVQVDLPKTSANAINPKGQEPLVISVDDKGYYYLNVSNHPNKPMNPVAVATRVAAELQLAKQTGVTRQVLVKGDQHVPYGSVVQAMVMLQHAGADHVGLITDPQQEKNG